MFRFAAVLMIFAFAACKQEAPKEEGAAAFSNKAPENAEVYFIQPVDGAVVDTTFSVKFGLKGMGVAPAGVMLEFTGHHHILIDLEEDPDFSKPLPANDNIVHFGGGQTETQITLKPGKHTLQLLLGNFAHIPHDTPVISEKITITVK
jgi:hypothetical protein